MPPLMPASVESVRCQPVTSAPEPGCGGPRPTGMRSPRFARVTQWATRTTTPAMAGLLVAGACLLAAGCSAGSPSASSKGAANAAAPGRPQSAVGSAVPGRSAAAQNGSGQSGSAGGTTLALPAPAAQSIIYTASLTVRAADITRAATQATRLARAAGGYLSSEKTALDRAHPGLSTIGLELKIPVAAYPATLDALGRLGTRLDQSQQAQDVTQTVADVTSRVTSAQAAITQLRALLTRAGSVSDLLSVQNQISAEETSLEELQAQQRALTHETTYATVSLLLVSRTAPAIVHKKAPGGFVGGLKAGWHGLVRAVSVVLTGAGAALPFALLLVPAGYLTYRWLTRRSARRRPATGAGSPPAE
jgi:hypothetical protein